MKPAVSLRLSVTSRCQLRCLYCRPAAGPGSCDALATSPLSWDQILGFVTVLAEAYRITKIHLTGGEPLLERDLESLITGLSPACDDLALTTNGQALAKRAAGLRAAGLRRVNISLDSLDADTFTRLTRGGRLQRTLEGIEAARAAGLSPIKLNVTVLRGFNDDQLVELARRGLDHGCEVRFLELMPIGPARDRFDERYVPAADILATLQTAFTLLPLPEQPGRSARRFAVEDTRGRRGRIGLISPTSQPFCHGCRRLRLTRDGRLITCLASGHSLDIGSQLRNLDSAGMASLRTLVAAVLDAKGRRGDFVTGRSMHAVGG